MVRQGPSAAGWLRACLPALVLALPTLDAEAGTESDAEWIAAIRVRFDRTGAGTPLARVEVALRPASPDALRTGPVPIEMARDGFPGGYGSRVWGLRAEGDAGIEPVSIADGHYRLERVPGAGVQYRYGVLLDHDASDWGPGPDEAPYSFVAGAFWTGRSLFLLPAGTRGEITLETPRGERVSTSLERVPYGPGTYSFPDEERLRESFLVAGGHGVEEFAVGRTTFVVAMGDALRGLLPQVKESITKFVTAATDLFGEAPARRVLVVANHVPGSGGFHGGVFGLDVSLLVGSPDLLADTEAWEPFLAHELFHLWNGTALSLDGQQYWFTEGFTDYFSRLLLLRLGRITWERFLADLEACAQQYIEAAGGISLLAAGEAKFTNRAMVYDGGRLAALCLDVEIRKASEGKASLAAVMRALYAEARVGKPASSGLERIEAAVASAAGRPLTEFFSLHVRGPTPLPIAERLADLGIALHSEKEELPTTDWCVWTGLGCPSVTAESVGLHILRSRSPVLREGDIVRTVNSQVMKGFEDLRRALKGKRPGDSIGVVVFRSGKNLILDLTLGGDRETAVPTAGVVRTTVRVREDAGPAEKALRTALFGR